MDLNNLLILLGTYVAIVSVAGIIWYVLQVIAYWKIFTKAGQPGWKSIIPVYNVYTQYKITWSGKMFWLFFVLAIAANVLAGTAGDNGVLAVIGAVLMVLAMIISIISTYKLARAFGHGAGFTIGLLFLNPIFMLILGLGDSQYSGPLK